MPPIDPPPLSPSDISPSDTGSPSAVGLTLPDRVVVAGRVDALSGGSFELADAFATASIELGNGMSLPVESGDLVVVEIVRSGRRYRFERLVARYATNPPSGDVPDLGATPGARSVAAPDRGEHHRLRSGVGANLLARGRLLSHLRKQFGEWGFVEVDTPCLVPSPGLDLHLDAVPADDGWLATSPEYQMKRLLAGGVARLFQIAHVFRQGEIGARHNPEFAMLEWYRAFADIEHVMNDTEALVAGAVQALTGGSTVAGTAGGIGGNRDRAVVDTTPPFERIPVAQAFARYANVAPDDALALAERDEEQFFRLLVDRVEPALAQLDRPVFLTDYPIGQASLARANPIDPRVCERFELYVAGVELCNGFGELTDPKEQRRRFEHDQRTRRSHGKPVYPLDTRFLAALDEGMPPAAGNALGLDRLLALCVGEADIARVMPFPAPWL